MRNIFGFSKKSKLSILQISNLKFYIQFIFIMPSTWACNKNNISKYIETKVLLPHVKLFQETKRGMQLVSLLQFMHD